MSTYTPAIQLLLLAALVAIGATITMYQGWLVRILFWLAVAVSGFLLGRYHGKLIKGK